MTTYTAKVTREGNWWAILTTAGTRVIATQTKRLEHVERIAGEAVALALDIAPETFTIEVEIELPEEITPKLELLKKLNQEVITHQQQASKYSRDIATELAKRHYTVRDTGKIMGLSPQRVSQLLADA